MCQKKDTEKMNLSFYKKRSLKTLPFNILKVVYPTPTFFEIALYQIPDWSYKELNLNKNK